MKSHNQFSLKFNDSYWPAEVGLRWDFSQNIQFDKMEVSRNFSNFSEAGSQRPKNSWFNILLRILQIISRFWASVYQAKSYKNTKMPKTANNIIICISLWTMKGVCVSTNHVLHLYIGDIIAHSERLIMKFFHRNLNIKCLYWRKLWKLNFVNVQFKKRIERDFITVWIIRYFAKFGSNFAFFSPVGSNCLLLGPNKNLTIPPKCSNIRSFSPEWIRPLYNFCKNFG